MFSRLICLGLLEAYAVTAANQRPVCRRSLNSPSSFYNEECTDLDTWGTGEYLIQDCYNAVQYLHESEVYKYGSQEWEFLAPGAKRREKPLFLTMQTPRRYTSRECALETF